MDARDVRSSSASQSIVTDFHKQSPKSPWEIVDPRGGLLARRFNNYSVRHAND
jgi:hypothetical protein